MVASLGLNELLVLGLRNHVHVDDAQNYNPNYGVAHLRQGNVNSIVRNYF